MVMAMPTPAGGGFMNAGAMNKTPHHNSMHMTFFWGTHSQILFSGWPGDRGLGMYLLTVLLVFVLSAAVDCLATAAKRLRTATMLLTALHALKMGMHYLVMLAVMSFNVGVLLAAVAGHSVGFLLSRSLIKSAGQDEKVH